MGKSVHIISRHESINKKYNTQKVQLQVRIKRAIKKKQQTPDDVYRWYIKCFDEILKSVTREFNDNDYIGVKIGITGDKTIEPIGLSFRLISSLSGEIITDLLTLIQQSNDSFNHSDSLGIEFTIIKTPSGTGGQRVLLRKLNSNNLMKHKSKSLIVPKSTIENDGKCLPRSLIIAIANANHVDRNEMQRLLRKNSKRLETETNKLIKKCKIKINEEGCFLNDLVKVSKLFPQYQIIVYDSLSDHRSILYKSGRAEKTINLLHIERHFIAIKTVKGLFGFKYQCSDCSGLYNNIKKHKCAARCNYCRALGICRPVPTMLQCEQCNRSFRGPDCFMRHKKNKICKTLSICTDCVKFIDLRENNQIHVCSNKYCNICKKTVDCDHQCYIQPYTKKPPAQFCIIYFDLECTQNSPSVYSATGFSHKPILCIAQQICHLCFNNNDSSINCSNCKQREHIFEKENCVSDFVDFCEVYRPYARGNVSVIAHNFKSYDGHFIISELMCRNKTLNPIMNGLKILTILYDNHIRFIDSINFIPMALKKFPKAFGLPDIEKGFYPHLFNTQENYNYIGRLPDSSYFFENSIHNLDRLDFDIWYGKKFLAQETFDNRMEMIKYCRIDVELLRRGCTTFMNDFLKLTNFNPFLQAITLAQTVMCVYRKNFMPRNQLGIIPQNNYSLNINQSFIGQMWLIFQNKDAQGSISFDVRLKPTNLLVDGYDATTRTVYEFQVRKKQNTSFHSILTMSFYTGLLYTWSRLFEESR